MRGLGARVGGSEAEPVTWPGVPVAEPVRCRARTRAAPDAGAACPRIGPVCPGGVPMAHGEDDAILPYGSRGEGGPCW